MGIKYMVRVCFSGLYNLQLLCVRLHLICDAYVLYWTTFFFNLICPQKYIEILEWL